MANTMEPAAHPATPDPSRQPAKDRLAQPSSRFLGDDGRPDPVVRAALAAAVDHVSYSRAVVALCTARLLMPIVASGDETGHHDPDRHADMAAVTLSDGATSHLLAFTGVDALRTWQTEARPVLCHLDELAASVRQAGASAILLDAAGPAPFVLGADMVDTIAQGNRLVEFEDGSFAWVREAPEAD